jgi:hypothetical protein
MATPPVYSLRIFGGQLTATSSSVTVPAGLLYIVRDIDVVLTTPSGTSVFFLSDPAGGILWYVSVDPAVTARWQGWRGRQVYEDGEVLTMTAQSGTWDIHVSGYQLTLP